MRYRSIVAAAIVLVTALAGAATASHLSAVPSPDDLPANPGPEDLGVGMNDVREEPSHVADANGFPFEHPGPYWSPKSDNLVLDAFVAYGYDSSATPVGADVSNLLNVLLHGRNHEDYDRTMYPGTNIFGAWWGWWSDTGGGGDLQNTTAGAQAPVITDPNGAIDDGDDCKAHDWDEFTWRGANDCASRDGHEAHPADQMFAFIQPGTHRWQVNNPAAVISTAADHPSQPDFEYQQAPVWEEPGNRFMDIQYDSSLLITTEVVTAVNPKEVPTDLPGTTYNPFEPASGLDDPARDHAVDVDVYTAAHRLAERAYRATVWDPGDGSGTHVLHPNGPKGFVKDDGAAALAEAQRSAQENASQAAAFSEPQRGFADDLVRGPFPHEPNTAADQYGLTDDETAADWATFDADTRYGGLDGDYYAPGDGQTYDGYRTGERFWADARVNLAWRPTGATFGGRIQVTPEVPSTTAPVESLAREGDDNTHAPGVLYFRTNHGTWYDASKDTWVGTPGEDGSPYDNGTTQEPNQYQSSAGEFRGTCGVDIEMTLRPTSDTDGDGTDDWGRAGVYVMGPESNTYGSPWMDVVGHDADPVLDPLRNQGGVVGDTSSTLFPDRGRLDQYRRTGPIDITNWQCHEGSGSSDAAFWLLLPTGTLDFSFEAVTDVELTDPSRKGGHGETKETLLTGQSVHDVDRFDPIVQDGS